MDSSESSWPISFTYSLQWGDLDANRHINNLAFLRVFQEARIQYSMPLKALAGDTRTLVLASMTAKFVRQVHYPGELRCRFRVELLSRSSYEGSFEAHCAEGLAFSATCAMMFVDNATKRALSLNSIPGLVEHIERVEAPRIVPRKGNL